MVAVNSKLATRKGVRRRYSPLIWYGTRLHVQPYTPLTGKMQHVLHFVTYNQCYLVGV